MLTDLLQLPLRDGIVYDELSADGAAPRPHWKAFVDALQQMPAAELANRWARAERRIHENGVTYNMYGAPEGANRPWRTDLLPLLIDGCEWGSIETGLIQYSRLFELILQDLYGPQKLLTGRLLPPELVFANPAFLRPIAGRQAAQHSFLHLIALDLARSPNGQWWVVAHRTQAPSGAGYALENRMIVADALPELFSSTHVERLDGFFREQRQALANLARRDDAHIVLLTPGPLNETYFEHAYLARYLGITLVEGSDLTVRDRFVYMKTVEGLKRVDVILRRVDDSFCDPLELRADSLLGVSGLVDAALAGNVKLANALGSGLIETAGVLPFLPDLCRHLLQQDLQLPSVATWWCGQDKERGWVIEHLNDLVVKPAFPARMTHMEPAFGAELSSSERAQLVAQLNSHPFDFVAQESVALSKAPVWDRGHIYTRGLMLRAFVMNTGSGWQVLPGGLVRVAAAEDGNVVSIQRGGHSKDAWIVSSMSREQPGITLSTDQALELRRSGRDLPSRAADNLFWLGRYIERAENITRLLRTSLSRVRRADRAELHCLARLHRCFGTSHSTLPEVGQPDAVALENEFVSLMTDQNRSESLQSVLDEVRRVGGNVRERLSADMTRLIGQLSEAIAVEEYMLFAERTALLSGCLELLSAFSGMERENLTRGTGWLFLSLGRRLERAFYTVRYLQEIRKPLNPEDWPLLEQLLEVADSSITYRLRYYTSLHAIAVLDLLMLDESNPRSLDFQLSHLADLYRKLPRTLEDDARAIESALARMRSIDLGRIESASVEGCEAQEARLSQILDEIKHLLPSCSDNLSRTYFSHVRTWPISIGE
ncbi:MAG TPA: circularly permuted type 2 ATP-grasp protein [Bryobacteraceae bacterium]|jgi:uncharacterized circularly permuted ATP-grasp superfamily protein/uncharacterized alpha-E superfamily protein|nr:circularly permuted type 2 ATP-grasp protein [Bryobacteraceae bacterium]